MLRVVERPAKIENTGAQIVERRFVAGVAPKQGCQLSPQLTAIRAEGEISEKHTLALPRYRHFFAAGQQP